MTERQKTAARKRSSQQTPKTPSRQAPQWPTSLLPSHRTIAEIKAAVAEEKADSGK